MKKIFETKEKKEKKKKKEKEKIKDRALLGEELAMKSQSKKPGFFLRKSRQKNMENYQNLHHNIYASKSYENQPVISSNIRDYTTQSLHPPNYNMMNGIATDMNRRNAPKLLSRVQQNGHGMQPQPQRRMNMNMSINNMQQQPPTMSQRQYIQYTQQNAQRQRKEMQEHIASSDHMLVNPYRQFSIAFNKRPFNFKVQYRNGFNTFMNPSSHHIQQSNTLTRPEYIWGWYSVERHPNIPITISISSSINQIQPTNNMSNTNFI